MEKWTSLRLFLWMTLLTGVLYPLLITGIAQLTMRQKANGDFVYNREDAEGGEGAKGAGKGKIIGSTLIGQKFESDKYFWGRPSSVDYNPLPSGGSNLGPTSNALKKIVQERKEKLLQAHTHTASSEEDIPGELLFASGSGLDPHISLKTAYFQMERVARARGVQAKQIQGLIDEQAIGFLGGSYVNVLMLNQVLDLRL